MKKIKQNKQKKIEKSKKTSVFLYLDGNNLEKWLNVLSKNEIQIFSAKKFSSKKSVIEIPLCQEKNVEKFLKSKSIIVEKKQYNGFSKLIKFFVCRQAIFIAILVGFCFFIFASNFVWGIEIWGNEKVSSEKIQQVLSQNGIEVFSPIGVKTNEEIGKIVLENFSEVSMVSVVKKGTKVIINIKEKLLSDDLDETRKNAPLVAKENGRITSIKLVQGTILVQVGQIVKVGDPLVAPYTIDSNGNILKIEPKAEITAEVWLSGESTHEENKVVKKRTGKSLTERKVVFLDKEIVTTKVENNFECFEIEQTKEILSSEFVPIEYLVTTYFEVEEKIVSESFENVKQEKILEAKNFALSQVLENDEVLNENYVESSRDGKTIVSYVVTVLRRIDV